MGRVSFREWFGCGGGRGGIVVATVEYCDRNESVKMANIPFFAIGLEKQHPEPYSFPNRETSSKVSWNESFAARALREHRVLALAKCCWR